MSESTEPQLSLKELAGTLSGFEAHQVQLYLITRRQREDLPKHSKSFDRFVFTPYHVDVNDDLQEYLKTRVNEEMRTVLAKGRELYPFDVTPDDAELDHVLTCSRRSGDIGGFQHLLDALNGSVDERQLMQAELGQVLENVWAYCIRFQPSNVEAPAAYCFQRFSPSKVARPEGASWQTLFISTSNVVELGLVKQQTMTLDCKVDCVYYGDDFYILSKKGFEDIAGLDEKYQERAHEFVQRLSECGQFIGLDHLTQASAQNVHMRRRLARFTKTGAHQTISPERREKMLEIAKRHNFSLKIDDDGKICIESPKDADLLIKLLDSYFLQCEQTGDSYGSFTKKRL